jgi:hypothetical protein
MLGAMGRFALATPPELEGIILDFTWDRARLHALVLPVDDVPVAALAWMLDLRWWKFADAHFAVTPNQVRANPTRYALHWKRTRSRPRLSDPSRRNRAIAMDDPRRRSSPPQG